MTKTADHPLLSDFDVAELIEWRRNLHRQPELSGQEERTAETVGAFLANTAPDRIITGIGGYGVAAIYDSGTPGLRVLLRCELDGLPTEDLADVPHRSTSPGKGHQCGHDGHMAILAGMARILGQQRPASGAVVLMFQPAEEDGSGALAVVNDAAFDAMKSDYALCRG